MTEGADAAEALGVIDELVVVARFDELLLAAMHEADLGHGLDDLLILDDEVQMKRLGENRICLLYTSRCV